jgi:hypothetical protein
LQGDTQELGTATDIGTPQAAHLDLGFDVDEFRRLQFLIVIGAKQAAR